MSYDLNKQYQGTRYIAVLTDEHGFNYPWDSTISNSREQADRLGAQEAESMTHHGYPRTLLGVIPIEFKQTGPMLTPKQVEADAVRQRELRASL